MPFVPLRNLGLKTMSHQLPLQGFEALYKTAAIEDVKTILFTDADFAHDFRTLRVPFTAGSIN